MFLGVALIWGICPLVPLISSLWSFHRLTEIAYASWGPIVRPCPRSFARDPTIKAIRGTVAIEGVFDN